MIGEKKTAEVQERDDKEVTAARNTEREKWGRDGEAHKERGK